MKTDIKFPWDFGPEKPRRRGSLPGFVYQGFGLAFCALALVVGCAHRMASEHTETAPTGVSAVAAAPSSPAPAARVEQIRAECIQGRRLICGRVLKVCPGGLVVDSGYTDLLRPPLTSSWVIPGTATASRNSATLELNEPGTPCIGLLFLTDLPKKPKVNDYDYVVITGYPAGSYVYTPAPGVEKTIRKFAAGLDTATRLRLQEGVRSRE